MRLADSRRIARRKSFSARSGIAPRRYMPPAAWRARRIGSSCTQPRARPYFLPVECAEVVKARYDRRGAVKRTTEAIERDLAALIKHGNDIRRDSAELSRTA